MPWDELRLSPDNRSFRYGDGFFETIRMVNARIPLLDLHTERFFASLEAMHFEKACHLTPEYLLNAMQELANKNEHTASARIRLTVFRNDGGLFSAKDHFPQLLIQSWPLDTDYSLLNDKGLTTGIYTEARKVCDSFSRIKHNNYLPYVMAALFAAQQQWDDAIVLNPYGRVADATIANVFVVKDGMISTPSLGEGCVNGVMRRYLLDCFRSQPISFAETALSVSDLQQADEIFLTNALYGMRWVATMEGKVYGNKIASTLYHQFIEPLG